ncbi:MAG: hypothetical protein WBB45_06395 [Cyclobacteriaceae bacterium]
MKSKKPTLQDLRIKSFITVAGKNITAGVALQENSESVKPRCGTGEADCTWMA